VVEDFVFYPDGYQDKIQNGLETQAAMELSSTNLN
jgi:hypothetical protein